MKSTPVGGVFTHLLPTKKKPYLSHLNHICNSKIDKTYLRGLKNLKKNIFNVLEASLDENLILKKKSQNLPLNTEICEILKLV